MKSPLNIAETVKRYNLDAELKKKLIAQKVVLHNDKHPACRVPKYHQEKSE